jgi:plastocyanin
MRKTKWVLVGVILASMVTSLSGDGRKKRITVLDDCDPGDPAWNATGGCTLDDGSVGTAEFFELLASPLSVAVVGHPAWTTDPTYLKVKPNKTIEVTNEGGRLHTFTHVENYGGGFVPDPALNLGLTTAPECNPATIGPSNLPPGASLTVKNLAVGEHRFQCCIHPWMRTLIKVERKHHGDDDD